MSLDDGFALHHLLQPGNLHKKYFKLQKSGGEFLVSVRLVYRATLVRFSARALLRQISACLCYSGASAKVIGSNCLSISGIDHQYPQNSWPLASKNLSRKIGTVSQSDLRFSIEGAIHDALGPEKGHRYMMDMR